MAPIAQKRRRDEKEERRPKKKFKKVKKQTDYHSSSEDEEDGAATPRASDAPKGMPKRIREPVASGRNAEPLGERGAHAKAQKAKPKANPESAPAPKSILKQSAPAPTPGSDDADAHNLTDDDDGVTVDELEKNTALNMHAADSSAEELDDDNDEPDLDAVSSDEGEASASDDDDDDGEDTPPSDTEASVTSSATSSSSTARARKKRNDPTAFATSISKILDTKLSTAKRSDPVLSRSKSAADANRSLADARLEVKARAQIRAEKKAAREKGHVKDVLGVETAGVDTGAILEEEKRLKKTAQRGVVKLFNAVRAAQVKAEEAMRAVKNEGVVGMQKREEKVNEMSKQGFLELISSGGKKPVEA
jgi:hypothetical protein